MTEKKEKQQGFFRKTIRAWAWLIGMLWLGMVVTGIALVLPPSRRYPPIVGWVLLVIAAIVFLATMDHWVRTFAGLVFVAALRAGSTILIGHLPEDPDKSIPAFNAVIMTAFLLASAWLIYDLADQELKMRDRLALFAFTSCLFWGMADERKTMLAITVAFAFLVATWAYDRLHDAHHRT